jgi:methyl-accepting chemotaxis protein
LIEILEFEIVILFFDLETMMMNITEIINNLSEESLIAIGVFSFALLFYILRLISTLKSQVIEFEEADESGRQSLERDLMIMNRLVDDLRHEFKSVQDDLEEELVQHELTSLSLTPKFRKIESSISNTFDKQTDSLIDIQRNLNQISSSISDLNLETSSSGISEVNGVLPAISDKLRVLNDNLKSQGSFVYEMQRELELVKRACGVD